MLDDVEPLEGSIESDDLTIPGLLPATESMTQGA
jgi:hypothetical protein